MKMPNEVWWKGIKVVADAFANEKTTTYEEKMIRQKIFEVSCAIEDLVDIL